jgi:spore germination protein GerM
VRWWWILIAVLAAVVGFVLVRGLEELIREPSDVEEIAQIAPGTALRTVQLFFGSPDHVGFLAEERAIVDPENREDLAEEIVNLVLEGPTRGVTGLPPDAKVRALYITDDGVVFLDLSSELLMNWPAGDGLEWISLGSLVRSLTGNIPSLQAVQILIDGHVVARPPGSIPLDLPLEPEWFGVRPAEVIR